ncbi:MAG: glycosyltransferase [Anaerolineales bacterium]|jgi:trehalose synthase
MPVDNSLDGDKLVQIEEYAQFVGDETVARILSKAEPLQNSHVVHVNSTYYGGGVAEMLSSLTLLLNSLGIKTGWRVIQGAPDFFSVTKKMHNALQGGEINMTDLKKEIYEHVIYENAARNHLDHDFVFIHDPQPLPMIKHYNRRGPWIWRCHLDLTDPHGELWDFLKQFIELYDAVVVSLPEYKQDLPMPQCFFMPAIDPFTIKNRPMSEQAMRDRLDYYDIPTDLPLITQISRFDRWKDPQGVISAFKMARQEIDATLVLLGNVATDDPEGEEVYQSLLHDRDDRIIIMSREDTALVNALQSLSAVIVQKSIREGFGLTVTEAMWKETPVIGGDVGGIRHQIVDGQNGFLVGSIEEAAQRMIQLVREPDLRKEMGQRARRRVLDHFLMSRLLEQHLDLMNAFHTDYELEDKFLTKLATADGSKPYM